MLAPANQRPLTVVFVAPYGLIVRIAARIRGAIAQLGEHLHGMQKVRGSSPRRSTNLRMNDMAMTTTDQFGRSSADLALTGVAGA